ncbi:MAG: galactose-1-epimerase, partial [Planctomycetaceae bacterium]|nr:galactose-1-epimerase [Planctomycetaceae bacterium]
MKFLYCLLISFSLATTASAQVEDFDSIKLFTLKNENGMTVKVTNYGAIITS